MIKRHALVALAAAFFTLPSLAMAQDAYPARAIKMIVGFPPGTSTDVAARIVAQHMSGTLGKPVVVDNRAGASSNTGAQAAANSPADGYTLFVTTIANTINQTLQPAVAVNLDTAFDPVAMIGSMTNLLVVNPTLEVASVSELVAAAKKKPDGIAYASSGTGTSPHLSGELFNQMAGTRMFHVPYKGSAPAVTDLLAGQVLVMFSPASSVLPHIKSGKLKALASTGATRSESTPDLPTVAELGLTGFETSVWFGVEVPKGTPAPVIETLRKAIESAQKDPAVREQFKAQGIDLVEAGTDAFRKLIDSEISKWGQVIKSAGIKAE
ncbi:MAG: tripartite tricarboxylate transporter substrate binding protein [Rhizobiales bacterium]|nr:tripartite tricarboxylate transporter substrate binding protein [Hyphomicrobiales bacterium]